MSADLVIVSREDDSWVHNKDYKTLNHESLSKAVCIDETSMGEPWTEFGRWFAQRYCRAPGLLEQLAGHSEHDFVEFTEHDLKAVESALATMEHRDGLTIDMITPFVGKHISTECW